jgi:hypothetical protein
VPESEAKVPLSREIARRGSSPLTRCADRQPAAVPDAAMTTPIIALVRRTLFHRMF